jgi:phenylalanyl-tRNA synthetase beta chain
MKISYNWLQSFSPDPLPKPHEISELLTFHSFEVEGYEEVGSDWVFDIAVLPNRAHDALSHWSIAWEIASLQGKKLKPLLKELKDTPPSNRQLSVKIEDTELCPRYTGRVIENITVGDSPIWLRDLLFSIGQRSINVAVDIANYVMFSVGQPMHVFDADKLSGNEIIVRHAKEGERITTLDGKDVVLNPSVLIIADSAGPLAIAGIKGGTRAEVDKNTKNIIIEAANFHGTNIRRTAKGLGIRTDASVRFEHELAPHLVEPAMKLMTELILDLTAGAETELGAVVDVKSTEEVTYTVKFTTKDIERLLGVVITEKEIEDILNNIGFEWKAGFVVTVPPTRLDLRLTADMVEEVGRYYGYDKIPGVVIPSSGQPKILKSYYYSNIIRDTLSAIGFSEVYGYSFAPKGEIALKNPLAEGKDFMRTSLTEGISERIAMNIKNKDLLGLDNVNIFEIGNIYLNSGERLHCAIASSDKKLNLTNLLPWVVKNIYSGPENILEFDLTSLMETLPEPTSYSGLVSQKDSSITYKPFSLFPFVSRDIAVFVPINLTSDSVLDLIKENAGNFLIKTKLFDQFTKKFEDGTQKTSYAFRLIFQSNERTLTGEEVTAIMDKITNVLNSREGWKVR